MRWWLTPQWSDEPTTKYPMFNARCERLMESRAYQGSFRHKRCIIPASSFVEWQRNKHLKTKAPHLFNIDNQTLALAGIWEYWTDGIRHLLSCAIVSRPSPDIFSSYYHRLPVILTPEEADFWLTEPLDTQALLEICETAKPTAKLHVSLLDRKINDPKHKEAPTILETLPSIDFQQQRTVQARWTF